MKNIRTNIKVKHILAVFLLSFITVLFLVSNVSADTVLGPIVTSYTPNASISVDPTTTITVTFDAAVNNATTTNFTVKDKNNSTVGSANSISGNGTSTITLNLSGTGVPLTAANSPYTVTLTGSTSTTTHVRLVSDTTKYLQANYTWKFWVTNSSAVPHRSYSTDTDKCGRCHQLHQASSQRLLRKTTTYAMCMVCHDGSGSTYNIASLFTPTPTSYHPVEGIGYGTAKVKCYNCHNPHSANSSRFAAPGISPPSGAISMAKGVYPTSARGAGTAVPANGWTKINDPLYQYQLCYKCHSTYDAGDGTKSIRRDVAVELNPANPTFHPIEGNSPNTKGYFVSPYNATTRLQCTSCHTSPTGASGPHSSTNAKLLVAPYDNTTGNGTSTHLCFRCHSESAYSGSSDAGNNTGFYLTGRSWNGHNYHRMKIGSIKCQWCHSPVLHGNNLRKRLIVLKSDAAPYEQGDFAKITSFTPQSAGYSDSQTCGTDNSAQCYKH